MPLHVDVRQTGRRCRHAIARKYLSARHLHQMFSHLVELTPNHSSTTFMSVVRLYFGKLSTNTRPYCFFRMRLSSSTSSPRSCSDRISLPNPCFKVITA